MKNILTIAKKEVRSYFINTSAYVVMIVFLLIWEGLFFRNAFLVGEANLRGLFDLLPWVMLVLAPAVTMNSIGREREDGTLELVLTHPISERQLVIGKFLGNLGFIVLSLIFAVPIAIAFANFGRFDFGVFGGQMVAGVLLAACMVALGLYISAMVRSSIAAMLLTAAVGLGLILIGGEFVTATVPLEAATILERMALQSHVTSMSRGVIDLRDVWYFGAFIAIFLSLTYLQLIKRKYGNLKRKYASFQLGITLGIGIAILLVIVGERIPGRLDLTGGKLFTLSAATGKTLKELPDVVNITLYASSKLPPQYAPIVRDTKDILKDYQNKAGHNIQVTIVDPANNPTASAQATAQGIREVQFNVIGQEEFAVKTGFLGMAIEFGGKTEAIPFIEDTTGLEYIITSDIQKLTIKDKKQVAFLSGQGEKSVYSDFGTWKNELDKFYTLTEDPKIATQSAVLVVAGPSQKLDDKTIKAIDDFIKSGRGVLFLDDTYDINPQVMMASTNESNLNELLGKYGVTVKTDVVYDLRSNETVRFGGEGGASYFLPYPYWIRAQSPEAGTVLTNSLTSVVMPWPSSVELSASDSAKMQYGAQEILTTSKFANTTEGTFSLSIDQTKFNQTNLKQVALAVALSPTGDNKAGKLIVVGDGDWLTDQFVQNNPDNLSLGLAMMHWLAQDAQSGNIPVKKSASGKLTFSNDAEIAGVKYGNLALAVIVPVILGSVTLLRRRALAKAHFKAL